MSEPKFTPGPWRMDRATGGGPTTLFYWIASYSDEDDGEFQSIAITSSTGPMEANGRLIAAAPELFDALNSLLAYHNEGRIPESDALARAEAAIAKANHEG